MSLPALLDKVNNIRTYINSKVFEREAETDSAFLTLMAGTSCLLLGDAGAGKTKQIELMSQLFGLILFDTLMSETTKPDHIFGGSDVPALVRGTQRNKIEGYAPTAEVLFFDEIFKATGTNLNPLLMLINEHKYRNGDDGIIKTPTLAVFAASNEVPSETALRPIYDRFMIRHKVDYMKSPASIDKMFVNSMSKSNDLPPEPLTKEDVLHLRSVVRSVEFPKEHRDMVIKIRDAVQNATSVIISDRRLDKSIRIIQAHALLNRRGKVDLLDLEVLQNIFWDDPAHARKVSSIVTAHTGALSGDFLSYVETAEKVYEQSITSGNLREGFIKLKQMVETTKKFSTQNGRKIHRTVFELAYKLRTMLKERKDFIINILPDSNGRDWYKLSEASSQLWTKDQLRSVGFKWKRTLGYWWIPSEARMTEQRLSAKIAHKLKVAPQFKKLT